MESDRHGAGKLEANAKEHRCGRALPLFGEPKAPRGRMLRPWGWYAVQVERGASKRRGVRRERKAVHTEVAVVEPHIPFEQFMVESVRWAAAEARQPGSGTSECMMIGAGIGAAVVMIPWIVVSPWTMMAAWMTWVWLATVLVGALVGWWFAWRAVRVFEQQWAAFEAAGGALVLARLDTPGVREVVMQLDRMAEQFLAGRISREEWTRARVVAWQKLAEGMTETSSENQLERLSESA